MQGVYTPLLCKNALTRAIAKNTSFKKHNDLVRSNIAQFGLEEDVEFENELPDFLVSGEMPIAGFSQEDNLLVLPFLNFFEFIQSKSYSEAICETIGSMMKIHGGKGRNLLSFNFSKEIYLNFNMPPLHVMKSTIISKLAKYLVEKEKKEYSRRTHMSRWLYTTLSATVGNFRKSEEKKSHTPLNIFNN